MSGFAAGGAPAEPEMVLSVAEFVAYVNQTLEAAYPFVTIQGELANFRVSRGRWVYFDLKDDEASVRFFGTVYALPGPLEDGLLVRVSGNPRLHPLYGFSVNVQTIVPVGEGALRRTADLLAVKLDAEGLFAPERKRVLPYPPARIALVTAADSAAYADFMKILQARWSGVTIDHYDVQVQGEPAPGQIVSAIAAVNAGIPAGESFAGGRAGGAAAPGAVDDGGNTPGGLPDVLVLTRGGGSAEDLAAFNDERVVRAVAGSRVPTLVAVGHEIDSSLAELAADRRASTPSNAAELLTPDRAVVLGRLAAVRSELDGALLRLVRGRRERLAEQRTVLDQGLRAAYDAARLRLRTARQLLDAYDPAAALRRGYALVYAADGSLIRRADQLRPGAAVRITLSDGAARATITERTAISQKGRKP